MSLSTLLAGVIYRWRFPLTGFCILGAILLAPRANITRIDNDVTAWFSRDDPVYRDYQRFREEFAGTRSLIVALQAHSPGRLFSEDALAYLARISGDIERVETVQRVDSLATATIVDALPDGLEVRPLMDLARTRGPDAVRRRALEDDLIRGDLVSEDATVAAVVVSFDEERIDAVRTSVIQEIREIVASGLPDGIRPHYNGSLEISETYNRVTLANQRTFTPPILLFTILAIQFTFRSWRKTLIVLVAIGISVSWTLGLYSLLGFSYNVLASMIVPLIVVLAIADDVHILQRWDDEQRRGARGEDAFRNTIAHLAAPLFGASVTTSLGMLSLATSQVMAVRAFGIGSAVGIMMDFVVSIVVVPTLLSLVRTEPGRETPHERYLLPPLRRVAALSTARPGLVFATCLVVALVAGLGILRLRVDTNHINFFAAGHPLNESAAVIDSQLAGVYSFQIMLEGPPDSLKAPDALGRIDRLQEELRRAPHVRKVTSIADYVKRIHRELNDGSPEAHAIPADAETIAQELFVFSLGGEGRHELERIVASDYSRAQIAVKLQSMSSDLVLQQVERADALARQAFAGTDISVMTTGSGRLFSTLDHYLVSSQLSSFGTAFLTVFGVIFIVFRSLRFGLLTILPNLLPVVVVLGVMGYLDISMNIATVMVASVALGVVDDDTIHFINRYRREIAGGASADDAIAQATTHEGRAALTTAVINSCGFAVLLLSEYKPTAWFGGLLALTMAVAFLAEVLILPAMIKLLPRAYGPAALRRGPAVPAAAALAVLALPPAASAQPLGVPEGHLSVQGGSYPSRDGAVELRARIFAEQRIDVRHWLRLSAGGFVEGLLAERPLPGLDASAGATRHVRDAVVRPQDVEAVLSWRRFDLTAGYTRVAWGRLDEVQPTDVVNPLDVSRFFLEGRSEARLPVALLRGRLFLPDEVSVEAVYVPVFRRGLFDQLDEPSSPFQPALLPGADPLVCLGLGCPALPPSVVERDPEGAQGGLRLSATTRRVDWSVSAYRGFEPFPLVEAIPGLPGTRQLVLQAVHPRFTMLGGDFETVRGGWGVRGEAAVFVSDSFQSPRLAVLSGSSVDAGIGVDRPAGDYRLSGTVMLRRESYEGAERGERGRTDLSIVASAQRSFSRARYHLRAFVLSTPSAGSTFARAVATADLRDNLALEVSGGVLAGEGDDLVARFSRSDFAYARLKYHF